MRLVNHFFVSSLYFKTRTPKGDGNPCQSSRLVRCGSISKHEPRKGTETKPFEIRKLPVAELISKHEPRKGTETSACSCISSTRSVISKHEPRKGTETPRLSRALQATWPLFQNTNPERGRKPVVSSELLDLFANHFKTRTPKGDGNINKLDKIYKRVRINFKTRTPKGDGNSGRSRG